MVRRWFYVLSFLLMAAIIIAARFHPSILWLLVIVAPVEAMGFYDAFQHEHVIRRNFPLVGRLRYLLEALRPEIQQYFIESNIDAFPIEREFRSIVYQRAKGELETKPFGTQRDVYRIGYEWAAHSMAPVELPGGEPRVTIGGPHCKRPYSASLFNISAMSFGALSRNAVLALNEGALKGGFIHNTGEGGLSPYHLEPGGDLIWQIGTGYFGCRTEDGDFDPKQFTERAANENVKMIEIKISQGAKPGHGGILPAVKVTPEIAAIRGVPAGKTVFSPPCHKAFSTPRGLVEFVAKLRELSGGKPVGFKLCVGSRTEFLSVCKAMLAADVTPDFITVDGGEGGTGAAPLEFSNSLGMPARDAWLFVNNALIGTGLRERIRIMATGKIFTGFHMVRALALGADLCATARGMMLALGCIQSLRCNTDKCPTGIATQNPALVHGLHVPDKAKRVARYHDATIKGFMEMLSAMGLRHPDELGPKHIYRRVDDLKVESFEELYEILEPGQLLREDVPEPLLSEWRAASADQWPPAG
jgi:glutamate synthase domain-containing protein 2